MIMCGVVLLEQRRQRQKGIRDVERMASASRKTSWTSERAQILATGFGCSTSLKVKKVCSHDFVSKIQKYLIQLIGLTQSQQRVLLSQILLASSYDAIV